MIKRNIVRFFYYIDALTLVMAVAIKTAYQTFLDKINSRDIVTIKHLTFAEQLTIDGNAWKAQGVIFEACTFEDIALFEHVDLKCGVQFKQCNFEKALSFNYCEAGQTESRFNTNRNASIEFLNCNLKNKLTISNCKFDFGIWAAEATTFESLHLTNTKAGKIQFENVEIKGQIEFSEVVNLSGFFFDRCTFSDAISFYGCDSKLIANRCTFADTLFSGCNFKGLFIGDSVFTTELEILGCKTPIFSFYDLTCEKSVMINTYELEMECYGFINELKIGDCDFRGGFLFTGLISVNNAIDIQSLYLNFSEKQKGNINFINCKIEETLLTGSNNASVSFAFSELQHLVFSQLVNNSTVSLISILPIRLPDSSVTFDKSSMGKTIFSDVDLNKYDSFSIKHSNVTEIVTNSVKWFDETKLKIESPALLKDVYRQLKFAMEKQGDNYSRLRFRRNEQMAYQQELKTYPLTFYNAGDKFIMWISRSNDYGYNWLKPFVFVLATVIIFHVILSISVSPKLSWVPDFQNTKATFNYLIDNAYNMFSLFNPAHKSIELYDSVPNIKSFAFYTWDFIERLILSYFLFQMLTAFRKYAK